MIQAGWLLQIAVMPMIPRSSILLAFFFIIIIIIYHIKSPTNPSPSPGGSLGWAGTIKAQYLPLANPNLGLSTATLYWLTLT